MQKYKNLIIALVTLTKLTLTKSKDASNHPFQYKKYQ
jgi:hypothetical protein